MVETIWRKPGGGQEHCEVSISRMCFIIKVERIGFVSEQEDFGYQEWVEDENTTQNEKGPAMLSPGTPTISLDNIILLCKPGNWHCQKKNEVSIFNSNSDSNTLSKIIEFWKLETVKPKSIL